MSSFGGNKYFQNQCCSDVIFIVKDVLITYWKTGRHENVK